MLFGRPDPVHASWAALANGMAAHSMELDDTFLPGSIHNEFFRLFPALAEERGASGKRFLEAVVAGFEVACRVAAALQPAVTNRRGFHPTGTTGALGAAAAAGTLLGLDAVLQLAARPGLQLDAIESIVVNTVQAAMALVCEPIEQKRRPKVMIDAQFSVPFNVALGLVKRRVSFVDFMPAAFADPGVVGLMDRVTCRVDPELDAQYPAAWPARVEVTLADGRRLQAATTHAKGDPRNPLSLDDVIAKHRSIVVGIVDDSTDEQLLDFILHIETKPDFSELTRILKRFVVRG